MSRKISPNVYLNPKKEPEPQTDICISRLLDGRCQSFRNLGCGSESRMEHMVMAHFLKEELTEFVLNRAPWTPAALAGERPHMLSLISWTGLIFPILELGLL